MTWTYHGERRAGPEPEWEHRWTADDPVGETRKWALRRRGRRIVASQVPDKRHRTRHGCLVVTAIDRVRGEITVGPVPN